MSQTETLIYDDIELVVVKTVMSSNFMFKTWALDSISSIPTSTLLQKVF